MGTGRGGRRVVLLVHMSKSGWGRAYHVSPVYHCIFTGISIQLNTIEWYQFLPN